METLRTITYGIILGLYIIWMIAAMRSYFKKDYPTMIWNMWWSLIMLILNTARW